MSRKNAPTLKRELEIIRIDFDDIWQKYSKDSRIELVFFRYRVGLCLLSTFRLSKRTLSRPDVHLLQALTLGLSTSYDDDDDDDDDHM